QSVTCEIRARDKGARAVCNCDFCVDLPVDKWLGPLRPRENLCRWDSRTHRGCWVVVQSAPVVHRGLEEDPDSRATARGFVERGNHTRDVIGDETDEEKIVGRTGDEI